MRVIYRLAHFFCHQYISDTDKKYLIQLYRALHPEDKVVTENDIADVTLKHVLVDADYNDSSRDIVGT